MISRVPLEGIVILDEKPSGFTDAGADISL